MPTSCERDINVNTSAVNIAVVEGKTINQATELRNNPQGHPVRITAVPNGKYILAEGENGLAPKNITLKRVGKDLHVALEDTDPDQPQLIIEGFFDAQGQLVGVAEDGAYYEYISTDADQDHSPAFLMDGVSSPYVLGAEQLSGFDNLVAGSGIGYFWPALLGLGLAGLALAGGGGGGGGGGGVGGGDGGGVGGGGDLVGGGPAPVLLEIIDNVGDKTGLIQSGGSTDDSTPTLIGTSTPGSTVIIKDGDKIIGEVVVGEDGKWEFTPKTPLEEGKHEFIIIEKDPDGNESKPSEGFELIIDLTAPGQSVINDIQDDAGVIRGSIPHQGATDDNTPNLSGGGQAPGDTVIVDENGKWTFTPSTPLNDGGHEFTIIVTDPAGNVSVESDPYTVIVDTLAPDQPVITSVVDDQGAITGPLAAGDITDDAQPQINGTAEPGTTVIIYDNGNEIGRESVAADGTWTHTPVPPLTNGNHSLSVETVDAAGNVSVPSPSFDFDLIAGGAPAAPAITGVIDDVDNSIGNIMPGGHTNDARPDISGTAAPGSVISVYANGTLIGTTTAQPSGQWTLPGAALLNDLGDGLNNLTATATNSAGNISDPTGLYPITVDTIAPDASTATSLIDDVGAVTGTINTGDSNPTYSGSAEPGATVIIYDKGVEIGRVPVDGAGNWSFTPTTPLADGDHSLTNQVLDAAGNTSPVSAPTDFTVDTSLVVVSITQVFDDAGTVTGPLSNGGVTDDTTPTLSGQATPNATVTIYNNGVAIGTVTSDGLGNWSFTAPVLGEGDHSFTATATTAAAGESPHTPPFNLEIDTTAPAKPGTGGTGSIDDVTDDVGAIQGSIGNGGTTDDTTPTLSGGGQAPGDTVTIKDNGTEIGQVIVDEDGKWTFTPSTPLNDGDHELTIIVTDPAGNASVESDPYTVIVDTFAPDQPVITSVIDDQGAVTGPLAAGDITDDARPDISGTAAPGSVISVYANGTLIGTTTVQPSGQWTLPGTALLNDLATGVNNLTATATNSAGNVSDPTGVYSITVDTRAPDASTAASLSDDVGAITGTIISGDITDDSNPTYSGSAEPGATVIIYDKAVEIGRVPVDGAGNWSFTPTTPLTAGDHSFTNAVLDAAGNKSPVSVHIDFMVDTRPVAISITQVFDDAGTVTGPLGNGGVTDDITPTISGQATPNATVTIYNNGVAIGTVTSTSLGNWSFSAPILDEGDHSFTATVTTAATGESAHTPPFNLTLDTTAPVTPLINLAVDDMGALTGNLSDGDRTDNTTPTLRGTAEPGSTVYLQYSNNGTTWQSAPTPVIADTNGNWSWTSPTLTLDNVWQFQANSVDAAGNESANTSPFKLNIASDIALGGFENFADVSDRTFALNSVFTAPSGLLFTSLIDDGNPARIYNFTDPMLGTGQTLGVDNNATFKLDFGSTDSVTMIMGGWGASTEAQTGTVVVKIYNPVGELVETQTITHPGSPTHYDTFETITPPAGEKIGHLVFEVNNPKDMLFDNISWTPTTPAAPAVVNLLETAATEQDDTFNLASIEEFAQGDTVFTGTDAISTLKLTGSGQVLDLTALTDKFSSIEKIDITGTGHNTLKLALDDVLAHGAPDLFVNDGKTQMMVNGDAGDVVDLQGLIGSLDPGTWANQGNVTVGGVSYNVYSHSSLDAELLVQQGVTTNLIV